jgi:hypothetical protein
VRKRHYNKILCTLASIAMVFATSLASATPPSTTRTTRPTVMAVIERIAATLRTARYNHDTRVEERAGRYEFDCSGMVAWVLARSAPQAHAATERRAGGGRPLARDYYRQIAASRVDRPTQGWLRVERVADAQPGDVVAWLKPPGWRSSNTGHVLFVVEGPRAVAPGTFAVRVADASAYQHSNDTREGTGRDGFGMGTMLLFADEATGTARGYGWRASFPTWGRETQIAIGRPVR